MPRVIVQFNIITNMQIKPWKPKSLFSNFWLSFFPIRSAKDLN
jgi:hypothetical protein